MRLTLLTAAAALLLTGAAPAEVKTRTVTYDHDGTKLKGYLAYDDAVQGKRPGVLVVHEWWGLNDYARRRAEQLAKLGYVAFAPDMYGDGKVTEHPKEASQMAAKVRENVKAWRGRAAAGLKVLKDQPQTDGKKLAAIGYCFGGSTALQLAYSGEDLAVVVTFHAALPTPTAEEAKKIKARLQVHHGAVDPFIPEEAVAKFKKALEAAGTDYVFISHGGAQHSFTVPGIDKVGVKGLRYDERADRRSWRAMRAMFDEVFAAKK